MSQAKPQPVSPNPPSGLSGPSRFLITTAAFVVVVAGMKAAVDILVPFLLAVFLAIISAPVLFWLKSKRISTGFAILLVSLIILLAGLLIGTLLTTSIADFTQDLPAYANKLNTEAGALEQKWLNWLEKIRADFHLLESDDIPEPDAANEEKTPISLPPKANEPERTEKEAFNLTGFFSAQGGIGLIKDMLAQFANLLTKGFLIYVTTIFILFETSILPGKIRKAMENNTEAFDNLATIAGDVKKYLALKTAISLVTGILIAIWLMFLGVKYPILWGLIAFLMNFVPNIGSIVAAVPACALALVQLGVYPAVLAVVGYLVVNITLGNIIEPRIMGQRMGLSTLVVFLSLVFWGWILGPVGMLLSVPLTMTVKIILESHPDTRKLGILLGSQNPPKTREKK